MNCANHPDRERIAFCQNCGKPLCQECARTVGSAVFCEPCLAAKLAGGGPTGTYTETPAGGTYAYTGNAGGIDYNVTGTIPPPYPTGAPNPGLAALLGLIPGVGAMYNGQYAKGVVHLIVFAILVSLADQHGLFGLFIAGWVCYQVIEAYHTARGPPRRHAAPQPLRLERSWRTPRLWQIMARNRHPDRCSQRLRPAAGGSHARCLDCRTPGTPYTGPTFRLPPARRSVEHPLAGLRSAGSPPIPPIPQYGVPAYPIDPDLTVPRNRFPAGALWLIGLGCVFLVGNAGLFHHFPIHRIIPFFLIGLGVWLFVHKMTGTGTSLTDDGTPAYQYRSSRHCAAPSG